MAENGTVFATSDFADIADTTSIRQSLKRLVENVLLLIAFYSPSTDLKSSCKREKNSTIFYILHFPGICETL